MGGRHRHDHGFHSDIQHAAGGLRRSALTISDRYQQLVGTCLAGGIAVPGLGRNSRINAFAVPHKGIGEFIDAAAGRGRNLPDDLLACGSSFHRRSDGFHGQRIIRCLPIVFHAGIRTMSSKGLSRIILQSGRQTETADAAAAQKSVCRYAIHRFTVDGNGNGDLFLHQRSIHCGQQRQSVFILPVQELAAGLHGGSRNKIQTGLLRIAFALTARRSDQVPYAGKACQLRIASVQAHIRRLRQRLSAQPGNAFRQAQGKQRSIAEGICANHRNPCRDLHKSRQRIAAVKGFFFDLCQLRRQQNGRARRRNVEKHRQQQKDRQQTFHEKCHAPASKIVS